MKRTVTFLVATCVVLAVASTVMAQATIYRDEQGSAVETARAPQVTAWYASRPVQRIHAPVEW